MLGRGVAEAIRRHGPKAVWGNVRPVLQAADAVVANLESPITAQEIPWRGGWKMFHFRADPLAVSVLNAGHVGLVNLANNHALDFGAEGLADTLRHLHDGGVVPVGAGPNATEAARPAILDLGGLKIGILGATDGMPEFAATPDRPGTNVVEFESEAGALSVLAPAVAQMRTAGAAIVILSLHWGPNMRVTPRQRIRRFAAAAVRTGVDVIHGHSAHVCHGIGTEGPKLVLFDTGDFITDYWKFPLRRNKWSFIFLLDVDVEGPKRLRLVPVRLRRARVELATGAEFAAICTRMQSLSARLGTTLVRTRDGLEWWSPLPAPGDQPSSRDKP